MPMYEYACTKCEESFETFVTNAANEPNSCPNCGGKPLNRLIGLPARPKAESATNCRGDGPPCGAPLCGRRG